MQNALLAKVAKKHQRKELPDFRPGDTIRVHVKIKEGDKERLQAFEGTVIARKNSGVSETVTVRKVSFGQGVERISRSMRRSSITSTWFAPAACGEPSSTICAT